MKAFVLGILLIVVVDAHRVEAHAFLERADPAVGSAVQMSPSEVRVLFSEKVEPTLSSLQVFDASGKQVDNGNARLDRSNHALLRVSVRPLEVGTYQVVWRVVSVDTHVTNGKFSFRVAR